MNPFITNAQPRLSKPTDYHADSYASAVPTPESFETPVPIIYMQGKQPECGADLSTQYLNILFGVIGSPRFTWNEIRKLDHLSPDDGSRSDTLTKEAQTIGTCDLSLCPDTSELPTNKYVDPSIITEEMIVNASSRKIGNYAFIDNPTMQQIKDNIFDHKAVGLRVDCGDAWWINGWSEAATCPLKLGNYSGGHFILATGFDKQYIKGPNSWSTAWGKQGMYYFDESYVPYVRELIVYIPPGTKYQFLTNFGLGTTSADVHRLQELLNMPVKYQTGYFGAITTGYVMKYQLAHGVPPTGYVGPMTRSVLNSG